MLISLTTDFGVKDWFVGTMKGVIHAIHPQTRVIDLTHEVPSGDIRNGAFALAAAYKYFPRQTIHVAVVDPGVGSARGALAIQTENYYFVGPDNGVLSWALVNEKVVHIRRLENAKYFLREVSGAPGELLVPVSQTFQGRDVFAPVAAHLSKGLPIGKLGPVQDDLVRLPWPEPIRKGKIIQGEVLYIDHFGNAITNIPNSTVEHLRVSVSPHSASLRVGKVRCPFRLFYQAVAPGKAVAVPGSTGYLEIAVNGGNASKVLRLKVGSKITILH